MRWRECNLDSYENARAFSDTRAHTQVSAREQPTQQETKIRLSQRWERLKRKQQKNVSREPASSCCGRALKNLKKRRAGREGDLEINEYRSVYSRNSSGTGAG